MGGSSDSDDKGEMEGRAGGGGRQRRESVDRKEAQKLKEAEEGAGQWSETHVLREGEGEEEEEEERDEGVEGDMSEEAALLLAKEV